MIPVQLSGRRVYIDQDGVIVLETPYTLGMPFSEGLAAVKVGEVWGFIDTAGQLVLEPQWSDVRSFSEGYCAVRSREGGWGLIDREGRWQLLPNYHAMEDCHCGLVRVDMARQYPGEYWEQMVRASDGAVVVDKVFTISRHYAGGLLAAHQDSICGRTGYLDTTGHWAVEPRYDSANNFSEGLGLVLVNERKRISAFINAEGREVLRINRPVHADHDGFKDGLVIITKENEGWGAMDREGREVIPCTFDYLRSFAEGLASARDSLTRKVGFIDKAGSWVIPPVFDGIMLDGFRNGVAWVWVEDNGTKSYYHVNRQGRLIWPPHAPLLEELSARVCVPVSRFMDGSEYLFEKAYPKAKKILAGHTELSKTVKKLLSQCRQDAPSSLWGKLKPAALAAESASLIREMVDGLSKLSSDMVMVWVALDDTPEAVTLAGVSEWTADPEDWGWTFDGGIDLSRSYSALLSATFEEFELHDSDYRGGGIVKPYDCLTMFFSLVYFGACALEAFALLPKDRPASLSLTIGHPDSEYGIILKKAEDR